MKTTNLIFVILFLISFGEAIMAQDYEVEKPELDEKLKVHVACIGNSITQGSRLNNPTKDCYPARLNEMLSSIYGDTCIVNNYGLSGRNMLKKGPNPIWDEPKFKNAISWEPDICFILLGTNDSRPDLWREHGEEFLADYLAMIDTFKAQNSETRFVIGAPSPIWEGHAYGGDTWGTKHNDSIMVNCVIPLIHIVSEKTKAIIIDFHTPFKDSVNLFPDRLHPNAKGANYMAKMILGIIEEKDMIHDLVKSKALK